MSAEKASNAAHGKPHQHRCVAVGPLAMMPSGANCVLSCYTIRYKEYNCRFHIVGSGGRNCNCCKVHS